MPSDACMHQWTGSSLFLEVVSYYSDVIMSTVASQITGVSIDHRKHQSSASLDFVRGIHRWPVDSPHKRASNAENIAIWWCHHCPASRTTLVATRFRVAVICPIIQVPHCIRVFFYFVWFVFINHIFQFYYELCTYCNILDIYLS